LPPFYCKPFISVRGHIRREKDLVDVESNDDDLLIFFKLVKCGYGSLSEVKEMNAEEVLQALFYESFCSDYQSAYLEASKN